MLKIDATDRICVAGLPRSGKTVLMRYLATLPRRVYIIDPLNQYGEFGEVGDVLSGKTRCVLRLDEFDMFEDVCKKLHHVSNVTLVVEEAEHFIAQGRKMGTYSASLIQMGRNWGIGIWCTTRRIQGISKTFFDLAQHVMFFRCGLKSRDYIADMIGQDYVRPVIKSRYNSTGYTITTLPEHAFLHFNLETEDAQISKLELGARSHIETEGKVKKGKVNTATEDAEVENAQAR